MDKTWYQLGMMPNEHRKTRAVTPRSSTVVGVNDFEGYRLDSYSLFEGVWYGKPTYGSLLWM